MMQLACALLLAGILGLGLASAPALESYGQYLLSQRYQLIAHPQQVWQQHCGPQAAGANRASRPLAAQRVLGGGPMVLACRHGFLWRSHGGWQNFCHSSRSKAVFSPRYYRLFVHCQVQLGGDGASGYDVFSRYWQIFT